MLPTVRLYGCAVVQEGTDHPEVTISRRNPEQCSSFSARVFGHGCVKYHTEGWSMRWITCINVISHPLLSSPRPFLWSHFTTHNNASYLLPVAQLARQDPPPSTQRSGALRSEKDFLLPWFAMVTTIHACYVRTFRALSWSGNFSLPLPPMHAASRLVFTCKFDRFSHSFLLAFLSPLPSFVEARGALLKRSLAA